MSDTLKLKAVLISNNGGKTWLVVHQYYLCTPQDRVLLDRTLEGRIFEMAEEKTVGQHV
jgi:hypothetical protein